MNNGIKFGTDGWRATSSTGLNEGNIKICAQSFSDYINDNYSDFKEILVGYDTRKDSYKFAEITCQVIKSNNINVKLTDRPTPTPICSHNVKNSAKIGAVIITASHNSKEWNGFKIRSSNGVSFNDFQIAEIEKKVNFYSNNKMKIKHEKQNIEKINIIDSYIKSLKKIVDIESINKSGINIVADYMHGAVSGILEKILDNNKNFYIRKDLDSNFPGMIQPEPIESNLKDLKSKIIKEDFSVGFAFDGDGDRLGVIDENGNFQSSSEVFSILASHVLENKSSIKSIATTVSMTSNIEEICKKFNSKVTRTKVGFKHLAPFLEQKKVSFAGEESGGYSMVDHVSDKDGIYSSLLYLEYLVKLQKKPSELILNIYKSLPTKVFERIDKKFSSKDRKTIELKIENIKNYLDSKYKIIDQNHIDGKKFYLNNSSWILLRLSGTEPVFRIYIESSSKIIMNEIKNEIFKYFKN